MRRGVYDPIALGLDVTKISNGEAYCLCPFHGDHKPSASFNVTTGLFICYACGAQSNAASLTHVLGGSVVMTTHEFLISKVTTTDDKEWQWILGCEMAYDNEYLASRGVTNKQVKDFDIRQFSMGVGFIFRNKKGTPIGTQIRLSAEDVSNRYLILGEKPPFWPYTSSFKSSNVVLVEGPFGVLNANRHGVENAFAVIGAQSVVRAASYLHGIRKKTIIFDDDVAGNIAAGKALSMKQGFEAYFPGVEADEEGEEFFDALKSNELEVVSSWEEMRELLPYRSKVTQSVERFSRKQSRKSV